jgi:hypothetical protein
MGRLQVGGPPNKTALVRHFPTKEKAQRFATDPEYRASLVTAKMRKNAKGK